MADQERVKEPYIRLYGLKAGLTAPKAEYLDKARAVHFNKAIDHLVPGGLRR